MLHVFGVGVVAMKDRQSNPSDVKQRGKRTPAYLAHFPLAVLGQPIDWAGLFGVAQDGKLRGAPLP